MDRRSQYARLPALVTALVWAVAGLALPVLLLAGRPFGLDRALRDALAGELTGPAGALTQLGSGAVLYPLLVLVSLARLRGGAALLHAALPVLALATAQVVEAVAFVPLDRPSPLGVGTVSFSSGHAMAAVLGWGLVAEHLRRPAARWAGGVVAAVVGLTRLLLGAHWVTDVLAAWAFGALALIACLWVDRWAARGVPAARRPASVAPAWATSPAAWAVTGLASLVPLVPLLTVPAAERMKDLLVYVGAGGTAGSGADVYDFRTAYDMPFTYPPFAAVLSEPFARVPLPVLHVLWVLATLAALVALARIAMAPVVLRLGMPLTLALLLVSSPVRSHLRFGQVGIFLVLLVAADLLRGSRWRGVGVGLAAAVKLTPGIFLVLLLVARQWRSLRTAVATGAACTLGGLLLLWPSAHEYLWRALWDSARFGPNDVPGNQSVRGMLLRSPLDDAAAERVWLIAALVLLAVAVAGARRLHLAGDRLAAAGVLAAASVAVSPISWVHHLVWLVLPLSALVAAGRVRWAAGWALLLVVSLPSLGTAGLRSDAGPAFLWHLVVDAQGLTAVLAVVLLPVLCRPGAGKARPPSGHRLSAVGAHQSG